MLTTDQRGVRRVCLGSGAAFGGFYAICALVVAWNGYMLACFFMPVMLMMELAESITVRLIPTGVWLPRVVSVVGVLLCSGVGTLAGWLLWRVAIRQLCMEPGVCQNCTYDLTGNVSGVCPECGTKIEQ